MQCNQKQDDHGTNQDNVLLPTCYSYRPDAVNPKSKGNATSSTTVRRRWCSLPPTLIVDREMRSSACIYRHHRISKMSIRWHHGPACCKLLGGRWCSSSSFSCILFVLFCFLLLLLGLLLLFFSLLYCLLGSLLSFFLGLLLLLLGLLCCLFGFLLIFFGLLCGFFGLLLLLFFLHFDNSAQAQAYLGSSFQDTVLTFFLFSSAPLPFPAKVTFFPSLLTKLKLEASLLLKKT